MTVAELILKLQECDQNATVCVLDDGYIYHLNEIDTDIDGDIVLSN